MKMHWNKKYTTILLYAILGVVCAGGILLGLFYFLFTDRGDIFKIVGGIMSILSPFFYGIVIAYILNFVLRFVEHKVLKKMCEKKPRLKLRRILALVITYAFAIAVVVGFFYIVLPQVIESISTLAGNMKGYVDTVTIWVQKTFPDMTFFKIEDISNLLNQFGSMLSNIGDTLGGLIPQTMGILSSIATEVMNLFVGLAVSIYLLMSKEKFIAQSKKVLIALVPERHVDNILDVCRMTNRNFGGFLSGKILDSMIMAVLYYLTMQLLGFNYALLVAVIMGVFNMIPFFGPIIGLIPACLILLINNPWHALGMIIITFVMVNLEGNLIGPKLIGQTTGLSAFWIIFSIILFGGFWGIFGMIVAVPIFSVIYTLMRRFIESRLKKKEKPVPTEQYTDPDQPIIF